jgi:small subunit ribosomal protein S7
MYGSKLVQQVINKVMVDGKKSTAEKIVYDALDILAKRTNQDPVPALEESVKQITPVLEVRSRRVGARPTRYRSRCPSGAPARWRSAG